MYPLPARVIIDDAAMCVRFGIEIAYRAQRNDTIALRGPVGVGKTTLSKGIIAGLGITEAIQSQTFTIIETYKGAAVPIHHIDLYRVRDSDMPELGIEDLLSDDHIAIIEWAERGAAYLPSDTIWIDLALHEGEKREARIAFGGRAARG